MAMNEKKYISLEELKVGHPLGKHPFESMTAGVPDGYFDSLPSKIQARVVQKQHSFSISWSWQRTVVSLAGAGLVAVLVWVTWPARQEALDRNTLSGISNQTILSYLDEEGVAAEDIFDDASLQTPVGSDSTLFQYIDVPTNEIRQHIESHELYDPQTMDYGTWNTQ